MQILGAEKRNRVYLKLNGLNLASKRVVVDLLASHGLKPLKKFGQNFLCDANIVNKIADSIGLSPEEGALEVGPGLGVLTRALAARTGKVVAVEIDRGMVAVLKETLRDLPNAEIIEGDILKTDLAGISQTMPEGGFHACGNLPYYITAKTILRLMESGAKSLTAMVQKEVAERLAAPPGSKNYGALTASVGYYAVPKLLFTVPGRCFYPMPDVDSAVVQMKMEQSPFEAPRPIYERVVRAAFSMRRKTLVNNLSAAFGGKGVSRAAAAEVLLSLGIPQNVRAEMLSPADFARLAVYAETWIQNE